MGQLGPSLGCMQPPGMWLEAAAVLQDLYTRHLHMCMRLCVLMYTPSQLALCTQLHIADCIILLHYWSLGGARIVAVNTSLHGRTCPPRQDELANSAYIAPCTVHRPPCAITLSVGTLALCYSLAQPTSRVHVDCMIRLPVFKPFWHASSGPLMVLWTCLHHCHCALLRPEFIPEPPP